MPKYELNFAWFGPLDIPHEQLQNMLRMSHIHKDCRKIVWIIVDPSHPNAMNPEQRAYLTSIGYELKDIDSLVPAETMPNTYALVQKLKESTLYSALGDILKFIFLTRPAEADAPLKRFYMEADNWYLDDLDSIVRGRGLVFHGHVEGRAARVYPDSFYLDIESRADNLVGQHFRSNLPKRLEALLSDDIMKRALHRLVRINIDGTKPLNQEDVIMSFGNITPCLLPLTMRGFPGFPMEFYSEDFAKRNGFYFRSWRHQVPLHAQRITQSALAVHFRLAHLATGSTEPLTFQYGARAVSEVAVNKYLTSDAGRDAGVDELRIPFVKTVQMQAPTPS